MTGEEAFRRYFTSEAPFKEEEAITIGEFTDRFKKAGTKIEKWRKYAPDVKVSLKKKE